MKNDEKIRKGKRPKKSPPTLTPVEEDMLRKRFGTGIDEEIDLEEIGKDYNMTREKIKEIEKKALERLKNNPPEPPDDVA